MISIVPSSLRDYQKKIDAIAKKVADPKTRRKIMVKAAQPIIRIAKENVPVDEGIVKKSIKVLREKKSAPGTYVGPQVSGAVLKKSGRPTNLPLMIEYGTVFRPPHPYMRPAAGHGIPQALKIAEDEYKKLVE